MNKKKFTYKEKAQEAFSRGEWEKALENFKRHCSENPQDLRSKLKVADLLLKLGRKKDAIKVYKEVSDAYAQDGFLLQAISILKMILRIDPMAKEVSERISQLYIEKALEEKSFRYLPTIPLFSDLNKVELQSLLEHVETKIFPKGSFICKEGEKGDSLMIIIRGEVAVTKINPEGNEIWVRNLWEGEFFGEFGFFIDQRRHANVKAVTECEILEISRDELEKIFKNHPRLKEVLQNLFKKRVLDLFLALSPLFSKLNFQEREDLFKRFRLIKVPSDTTLFRIGDPPTSLYMIKSGEVEIYTENRLRQKILLDIQKSGNFFGELSLILNRPRMTYAKTTQPSELLELTKEDFEAIIQKYPNLRSHVKELSSKRIARVAEALSQEEVKKAREAMV